MKKATTLFLILSTFYCLGQHKAIDQSNKAILSSRALNQWLNSKKQFIQHKALSFDRAYYTLNYDTANTRWDSTSRTSEYTDPLNAFPTKGAFSTLTENHNGQFWIKSDSAFGIVDTTVNRYKVPGAYGIFDTLKTFAWDSANASWIPFLEYRMTINSNKDVTSYETFINLQALGVPIPGMQAFARADFFYNAQNQLAYYVTKELQFGIGLVNQDSAVVTVNGAGYRTLDDVYEWNGSAWAPKEKITYAYTSSNEVREEILQTYDITLGYINSSKNNYQYDSQGNQISDSSYAHTTTWELNRIKTESYTSFGDHLQERDFAISNSTTYLFSEANYYYNGSMQRDSAVWQSRYHHDPNRPLLFEEKEIYRYTPFPSGGASAQAPLAPSNLMVIAGTKSTLKMGLTWSDNSSNEIGFTIERSLDSSIWVPIDSTAANISTYDDTTVLASTKYYYRVLAYNAVGNSSYSNVDSGTSLSVGLNTNAKQIFDFFPNPTQELIRFNLPTENPLYIFNLQGRVMLTIPENSKIVRISHLPNGLYLIGSKTFKTKLIKQ